MILEGVLHRIVDGIRCCIGSGANPVKLMDFPEFLQDDLGIDAADPINERDLRSEGIDFIDRHIRQNRLSAFGSDHSPVFIDSVMDQAGNGVSAVMAVGFLPAQDQISDRGNGQDIPDDFFNADIFCFGFSNDAQSPRLDLIDLIRQVRTGQGCYRDRAVCFQGQHMILAHGWQPPEVVSLPRFIRNIMGTVQFWKNSIKTIGNIC